MCSTPLRRLAQDLPVERQHRVAAEHQRPLVRVGTQPAQHRLRLQPSQLQAQILGAVADHLRLVDAADQHVGFDPGSLEQLAAGRTLRGEHEAQRNRHPADATG